MTSSTLVELAEARQTSGYFDCCGRSRLRGHYELCHRARTRAHNQEENTNDR